MEINMITFHVLTLFPEMFDAVAGGSITGRAEKNGLIGFDFINIRDFAFNKHKKTDLYPYSGGGGMIMTPEPIYNAWKSVCDKTGKRPFTIYMSPQGKVFNQGIAKSLLNNEDIVILCGHYEGVDQRIIDEIVDMEISIGDFVLTGGEIPAMAVIDAVSRMVPGVLTSENSYSDESHFSGLLEYPQYTRPEEFMGRRVPDVLLSGHHANIVKWKRQQSLLVTKKKRPDMLEKAELTDEDIKFLESIE